MSQSGPDMRASHRERQETVRAVRGQFREGRLSSPAPVGPGDLLDFGSCRFVIVDKCPRPDGGTVLLFPGNVAGR
ncbi:hypothetical protein GCM10009835_50680 [Planosporangium flavigriseum]|uniref:Uncharacterized protein n=1 Tax=Planosporangium flavigriseum TaxID=373681 RepID=A0A8J3LND8_9ACTN|nr:hypothetical protein Pfl04_29530 [Planosporangium flavigriseum]